MKIHLSEGPSFFIRDRYLPWSLTDLPLCLDEEKSAELIHAGRIFLAERQALSLLARAEQSSGGLTIKLERKGFTQLEILPAIVFLQEKALLDDYRFASVWISSRLRRHPDGQRNLVWGLAARGVPISVAQSAVHDICDALTEEQSCEKVASKLLERGKSPAQIDKSLRSRGFTGTVIRKTVQKLTQNEKNG